MEIQVGLFSPVQPPTKLRALERKLGRIKLNTRSEMPSSPLLHSRLVRIKNCKESDHFIPQTASESILTLVIRSEIIAAHLRPLNSVFPKLGEKR